MSELIKNMGVTKEELEAIRSDENRRRMLNVITAPDFEAHLNNGVVLAQVLDAGDPVLRVFIERLDTVIEEQRLRLESLRDQRRAFHAERSEAHPQDPVE